MTKETLGRVISILEAYFKIFGGTLTTANLIEELRALRDQTSF
jgi:hypothetical protein